MTTRLAVEDVSKVFPGRAERAVSDLTLTCEPGTALSIVGRNGAGKSTVLRMAAGILAPSSGRIVRARRTTALLDLGMGFHPDLTGRENFDLGLALAGFGPQQLRRVRADAIDFSGLGADLDRQLKHYSTGMLARLASSIAVHSRADLLLIDEVLAVGDAGFQRQMLTRSAELVDEGAALVLVTHSAELAAGATSRTVWLDAGGLVADGPTEEVLERYETTILGQVQQSACTSVTLLAVNAAPPELTPGGPARVTGTVRSTSDAPDVSAHVELRAVVGTAEPWMRPPDETREKRHLNLVATTAPTAVGPLAPGDHRIDVDIARVPVTPTVLEASMVLTDADGAVIDRLDTEMTVGSDALRPSYLMPLTARRPSRPIPSVEPTPGPRP